MNPIKMYHKPTKRDVLVYALNAAEGTALIFDPWLASRQAGNGWQTVSIKKLIPYPDANFYKDSMNVSKTRYNKAKSNLTLLDAIFETTDHEQYRYIKDDPLFNTGIDDAVKHQLEIMDQMMDQEEVVC